MTDVLWPTGIYPSSQEWGHVDNVGTFQSTLAGATRTVARTGARMSCKIVTPMLKGQDRARMKAFIASLRGKSNRAYIPDFSTTQRGSFPATELLTNGDFSNGTTGWSGTGLTLTASDGSLRGTATANTPSGSVISPSAAATLTQYAPYAVRGFYKPGNMSVTVVDARLGDAVFGSTNGFAGTSADASSGKLVTAAGVTLATSMYAGFGNFATSTIAGQSFELSFASLSRCILADAGPNALLQSDAFNSSWSATRAAVNPNVATAPDGTSTADTIEEDGTAANSHFVSQSITVSSAVADYSFACSFKAGTRSWACLQLVEATGSHVLSAFVNLATGAIGTVGVSGANWTNPRGVVVAQGNGWYRLHVTGRKTSAATSLSALVIICEADGDVTFSGLSAVSMYAWRASVAQSSLPVRGAQTTSSALASGTAQTGSGIYVKGLPASTTGLLKVGDPVERNGQINFLTAPLDSDAAGLGYLQCGNPWKSSVADNDPIIVKNPMSKMILVGDDMSYDTGPGQFSAFQLEFIEDVT